MIPHRSTSHNYLQFSKFGNIPSCYPLEKSVCQRNSIIFTLVVRGWGGVGGTFPKIFDFWSPNGVDFVKSPTFFYNLAELVVRKVLSSFVISYHNWFYVYKERCVLAGYGMLVYAVDCKLCCVRYYSWPRHDGNSLASRQRAACYLSYILFASRLWIIFIMFES